MGYLYLFDTFDGITILLDLLRYAKLQESEKCRITRMYLCYIDVVSWAGVRPAEATLCAQVGVNFGMLQRRNFNVCSNVPFTPFLHTGATIYVNQAEFLIHEKANVEGSVHRAMFG